MYPSLKAAVHPRERWDRNYLLLLVGLIWLAIGAGFGPDIAAHVTSNAAPYPLIVHVHAIAFVGWLVLLTVQVMLIRNNQRQLHRRVGVAGAVLALTMVVLGPATALYVDRLQLGTPQSDPAFLSTQLIDILAFAGLVAAAVASRRVPAAHKRLILLATIYIADAGFARITGSSLERHFGSSFWPYFGEVYAGSDLLIAAVGIHDLCAHHRLYPAYVAGAIWILVWQTTATSLYFAPFWKPMALSLLGR
jgi:hypothetical protein